MFALAARVGVAAMALVPAACLFGVHDLATTTDGIEGEGGVLVEGGSPTNLIFDGDFEIGQCDSWTSYNGVISADRAARNGNWACRVCKKPPPVGQDSYVTFYPNYTSASAVKTLPPGTYRLEAWVRRADGSDTFTNASIVSTFMDSREGRFFGTKGGLEDPNNAWTRLAVVFDAPLADADDLVFSPLVAIVSVPANTCLLVDDVSLTKLK